MQKFSSSYGATGNHHHRCIVGLWQSHRGDTFSQGTYSLRSLPPRDAGQRYPLPAVRRAQPRADCHSGGGNSEGAGQGGRPHQQRRHGHRRRAGAGHRRGDRPADGHQLHGLREHVPGSIALHAQSTARQDNKPQFYRRRYGPALPRLLLRLQVRHRGLHRGPCRRSHRLRHTRLHG